MGTSLLHQRICRLRFCAATWWHMTLSGRSSLHGARAQTWEEWLCAHGLRCSHVSLSSLSEAQRSVRKPRRLASHGKWVRWFGLSLPTHLFRQRLRRCLSLFHLNSLPNPLLSQSCGVIGHAVPSGVAGSSCFVHKPSCFLLLRFHGRSNMSANRLRDTPALNGRIGVSRGMSVSPVTLAPPLPRRLPSLFMAFLPPLPGPLALRSWLLHKTRSVCSCWIGSDEAMFNRKGPCGGAFCVFDRQAMVHARIPFRLTLLLFFLSTHFSAFHLFRSHFSFWRLRSLP